MSCMSYNNNNIYLNTISWQLQTDVVVYLIKLSPLKYPIIMQIIAFPILTNY